MMIASSEPPKAEEMFDGRRIFKTEDLETLLWLKELVEQIHVMKMEILDLQNESRRCDCFNCLTF